MAAGLFSTSLPPSSEVEVKKSFIQPKEAAPLARNHDGCDGDHGDEDRHDKEERDSWQDTQPTLRERNALMFNNEQMAPRTDAQGSCSQARPGSSVFGAMFHGDLAEGQSEIQIPDVDPNSFLILLKYMYSDEIELEADTVFTTLYAAKKYIVPALAKACVSFLKTILEARNACVLLSQGWLFEERELKQRCWEVVLSCSSLPASGPGGDPRNQWLVQGKALYPVWIPSMTLQEFADEVAQSVVLTLRETHDVSLWFTASNKPGLEFALSKWDSTNGTGVQGGQIPDVIFYC